MLLTVLGYEAQPKRDVNLTFADRSRMGAFDARSLEAKFTAQQLTEVAGNVLEDAGDQVAIADRTVRTVLHFLRYGSLA